jgi:prepilin-type N-terminal cleavage/methylation domain-containing protein
MHPRKAFTLIELLVVIAIIAILAVVVVLTLNPAEMLRQARDANRLSDLATINSAVNLYATDQSGSSGFSLGNPSSVYLSLPDSSSTCNNLGLATTSGNFTYACSSSTSSRNINTTGWIPVNLSLISSGSPLGSLPIDPVNQSSSGLYYTYYTNGSQFEVTSLFESQKNKISYGQKPIVQNLPELNAQGSNLTINPLFNPTGLVGYWPMDEGSGSSTQDLSGNNNFGTWNGSTTNGSYYASGKVGNWAGYFNGNTTMITTVTAMPSVSQITMSAWIYELSNAVNDGIYSQSPSTGIWCTGSSLVFRISGGTGATSASGYCMPGGWEHVAATYDGTTSLLYVNGVQKGTPGSVSGAIVSSVTANIGSYTGIWPFSGLIDDVRIYNRALSAAEIQGLYNAEK